VNIEEKGEVVFFFFNIHSNCNIHSDCLVNNLILNKKTVNIKYQISHNLHIENLKKTLQIFL
jgi:hypothetical protein